MSSPSAPSTASPESPRVALDVTNARRWTIVWLLFAASLINYFDRQTLAYALPLLAKDFQLDKALQGLVVSAFFWTYTSLQIPIGSQREFKGIVSLRRQRAWMVSDKHDGTFVEADIPAELVGLEQEWRES